MSQFTTEDMSRLVAAGTRDQLKTTIEVVAGIGLVHINDYSADEEGLSMGIPVDEAEDISRQLTRMRGCASQVESGDQRSLLPAPEVRRNLSDSLAGEIDGIIEIFDEIDGLKAESSQNAEELAVLKLLAPLSLELELMGGYRTVASFIGTVASLSKARVGLAALGDSALHLTSEVGKKGVVAVFCRIEKSSEIQSMLGEHDFQTIAVPEGEGLPSERIEQLTAREAEIASRLEELQSDVESWTDSNGGMLFGGMELLERDLELATAPIRVATSEHAFMLDGWVRSEIAADVEAALGPVCTHVSIEEYVAPAHSNHLHLDDDRSEMPPIEFSPRTYSKPFEMLTDVMGRPAYGRIDPTFFMFITYPLFFGLILGDMAYGLAVMGMAAFVWKRFPLDEMMKNVGGLLFIIGLSTVIFGYIYGEFAGFEFLPHGGCDIAGIIGVAQCEAAHGHYYWESAHSPWWIAWMTNLYPSSGELYAVWEGPLNIVLAYPFHRVASNLENLILITIYMGVLHVLFGLVLGFRDIYKAHGFVDALFEKGSWMTVVIGGFIFAYGFLVESASDILLPGAAITGVGVVMVMVLLAHFEKMGVIGIPLGILESLGMLPKVVSYVRLFAVGVVGVKIAATGNEMIYPSVAHTLSNLGEAGAMDLVLLPVLFVFWLVVQLFALVLGVFSPNIHTVRLHFVEWMMQFYEGSGMPFQAFGFKPRRVEVE